MTSRAGEAAAATKQGNTTRTSSRISPSFSSFFSRSDFGGEIQPLNVGPVGLVGAVRTCCVCLLNVA